MNQSKFIEEVEKLGIKVTDEKLDKLNKYYEMLIEYNKVMNLTGITEKEDVYLKHFYDSLTIIKAIDLNKVETLCDMGTGAGFPGLVLKIFYPNLKITLIDSLNKRIKFLQDVIKKLNLNNIESIHARLEEYGNINREKFDVITSRAVAKTNILLEYGIPMLKVNGYFIAMKSNIDDEKYDNALKILNSTQKDLIEFSLPIENSKRSLIVIKKEKITNKKYPRKNNEIKNKPL